MQVRIYLNRRIRRGRRRGRRRIKKRPIRRRRRRESGSRRRRQKKRKFDRSYHLVALPLYAMRLPLHAFRPLVPPA